eukprot:ANDGO_05692.mRNA.1 hypothetical protein NAEGRDRAFT_29002
MTTRLLSTGHQSSMAAASSSAALLADVPARFLASCTVDWRALEAAFLSCLNSGSSVTSSSSLSHSFSAGGAAVTTSTTAKTALSSSSTTSAAATTTAAAIVSSVLATTQRLLGQGHAEEAQYGAQTALRYAERVHGASSAVVVEAQLLVAKAAYAVQQFSQCEQFLAMARWGASRQPSTPLAIRAELHLYEGLLYASTRRLEDAVKALSTHVYYVCLDHTPLSYFSRDVTATASPPAAADQGAFCLAATTGYLQLGNVFAALGRMDAALACFDAVVASWSAFLLSVAPELVSNPLHQRPGGAGNENERYDDELEKESEKEEKRLPADVTSEDGVRALARVLDVRISRFGREDQRVAEAHEVLGNLLLWTGDAEKAREHLVSAYEITRLALGDDHPHSTALMQRILQL